MTPIRLIIADDHPIVRTGLEGMLAGQPDLELVLQLVARLARRAPSPVTPSDVAASHACRGSNVREILFDLYDRHERVSRARRTTPVSTAYTTRRSCLA